MFPENRPRRLRMSPSIREMVRETDLSPCRPDLPDVREREPPCAEGDSVHARDRGLSAVADAAAEASTIDDAGRPAVLLFGIPAGRRTSRAAGPGSRTGSCRGGPPGRQGRDRTLTVIADLCLCEYTSHGHCGVLQGEIIDNDPTLELYGLTAVSQAEAGADIIAPSGMMDGQVRAIRGALDEAGFEDVPIMSYAAKYASAFYGPFRDAAESAPRFGDRRTPPDGPRERPGGH